MVFGTQQMPNSKIIFLGGLDPQQIMRYGSSQDLGTIPLNFGKFAFVRFFKEILSDSHYCLIS